MEAETGFQFSSHPVTSGNVEVTLFLVNINTPLFPGFDIHLTLKKYAEFPDY